MASDALTPVPDPLVMLQGMIDRGLDPESLKKMMDLAERWQDGQAKRAYSEAMNRIQARVPMIVKQKQGSKSKYAPLEALHLELKPIYCAEGFSISYGTEKSELEGHLRIFADVLHKLGHERRYYADLPLDGVGAQGNKSAMNATQATGSTYSYGRRYLLLLIFNITLADEDNDGAGLNVVIGPEEARALNDLFDELRDLGRPVDIDRFLKWLNVESLAFLPKRDYMKAANELNRLRKMPEAEYQAKRKKVNP